MPLSGTNSVLPDLRPPERILPADLVRAEKLALAVAERIRTEPQDLGHLRPALALAEEARRQAEAETARIREGLAAMAAALPPDLRTMEVIARRLDPAAALRRLKFSQAAGWLTRRLQRLPEPGQVLADLAQAHQSAQVEVSALADVFEAAWKAYLDRAGRIGEMMKGLRQAVTQVQLRAYQLEIILERLRPAGPEGLPGGIGLVEGQARRLRELEDRLDGLFPGLDQTLDGHEALVEAVGGFAGLLGPYLEKGAGVRVGPEDEAGLVETLADFSPDDLAQAQGLAGGPAYFQGLIQDHRVLSGRLAQAGQAEEGLKAATAGVLDRIEEISGLLETLAELSPAPLP